MGKLGHVALNGTKVKTNASKHKTMSYGRMSKRLDGLRTEVVELLKKAEAADEAGDSQIIVSADVPQDANDERLLVPMVEQMEENLGEVPDRILADSGYFSTDNVEYVHGNFKRPFICRDRIKHSPKAAPASRGRIPNDMRSRISDRAKE